MRRQHAHLLAGHGNWQLVGEFTEVERGKHSDRPQLAAALAACKQRSVPRQREVSRNCIGVHADCSRMA